MNRAALAGIGLLVFCELSFAAHLHKEKEYQNFWCPGITEYRLDDGTRVDCLTDEYAIEFDFAPKWAEAVGQALYYSAKTGKKAGVCLIIEKTSDEVHIKRIMPLCEKYNIQLWIIWGGRNESQKNQ